MFKPKTAMEIAWDLVKWRLSYPLDDTARDRMFATAVAELLTLEHWRGA